MYDLYYHKSPNTYKISVLFEELEVDYRTIVVNVSKGEQFSPEFVALSPNSKVPVVVDHAPRDGGEPIVMFESGAILLYMADKLGRLIPSGERERAEVLKWLFWHAASQSPMNGQCAHFRMFSPESAYARERYTREVRRLARVLDDRLARSPFVGGATYSIADIACYPWFDKSRMALGLETLDEFPNIAAWFARIGQRPAIRRGFARFDRDATEKTDLEEFARNMFGHDREQARIAAANARGTIVRMGLPLAEEPGARG